MIDSQNAANSRFEIAFQHSQNPDPAYQLAFDQYAIDALEARCRAKQDIRGYELLRIWELPAPAIVMGVGGRVARETFQQRCEQAGVPILRRLSGGGTVVLGPGCLCFSLILSFQNQPELSDLHASYRTIMNRIAKALHTINPQLAMRGICDLALVDEHNHSKKVSGNAQRRTRHAVLHHGTLLYDFDTSLIRDYLREPPKMPEYRQARVHDDFVTQIASTAQELTTALKTEFAAKLGYQNDNPDLQQILEKRYGSKAWNLKR